MPEQQMPSDEAIMRSLNANPQIKSRIAALLAVVEDAADDLKEADAAEMRLIEEIRRMGQEAMQAWANRQNEITEQEVRQDRIKQGSLVTFFGLCLTGQSKKRLRLEYLPRN